MYATISQSRLAWGLLVVGLVLLGVKGFLLSSFSSDGFVQDPWDAELASLYVPYARGSFGWDLLVAPLNEHRVVLTRLVLLTLYELGGGWVPVAAMTFNALLHITFILCLAHTLASAARREDHLAVLLFTTVVFAVPIGIENLLMGLNTHFYALILFAFLGVTLSARAEAFSARWLVGLTFFAAGGLTMGSSALAPFAAAFVAAVQMVVEVRKRQVREVLGCLMLVLLTVGLLATTVTVPGHEQYRAHSVQEFLQALIQVTAIPLLTVAGTCFVHAPLVWLALRTLRSRPMLATPIWGVLAFAVWVGGQMLAVSFTRSDYAASLRYVDIFICLLPVNFLAILLLKEENITARFAKAIRGYMILWAAVIPAAVLIEGYFGPGEALRNWKITTDRAHAAVAEYLTVGDSSEITAMGPLLHPDPKRVLSILEDPVARQIMRTQIDSASGGGTRAGATKWWLMHALHLWVVPIALALAIVFVLRVSPRRRDSATPS